MPEKVRLLPRARPENEHPPRTSQAVAQAYRCKEGRPERVQNAVAGLPAGDRRRLIGEMLAARLVRTGLKLDLYAEHAVWRWLIDRTRTPDAWAAYARHWAEWAAATGRLSLSAQTDTSPRAVSDYLFRAETRWSPRTVAVARDIIRSWFGWLFELDLIRRSPVRRDVVRGFRVDQGRIVRGNGVRQALTRDEAERAIRWALTIATPPAGLSVCLQLCQGLRSIEVQRLDMAHLVEREGVWSLTVPGKGQKSRSLVLENLTIQAWHRYRVFARRQGSRGPLLRAPGGGRYDRRTIQRWAKQAAEHIGRGADISSHDLRRSFATLAIENGADLFQAQEAMGHSSPTLTKRCYVARKIPGAVSIGIALPEIQTPTEKP